MDHLKEEILLVMDSSTISYMEKCRVLLSALSDIEDWRWLQELYLKYALDQNDSIAGLSITCIGHIARIHQNIDLPRVHKVFQYISETRPNLKGRIKDSLDDISAFITS